MLSKETRLALVKFHLDIKTDEFDNWFKENLKILTVEGVVKLFRKNEAPTLGDHEEYPEY